MIVIRVGREPNMRFGWLAAEALGAPTVSGRHPPTIVKEPKMTASGGPENGANT
jgi:hypothetical protein